MNPKLASVATLLSLAGVFAFGERFLVPEVNGEEPKAIVAGSSIANDDPVQTEEGQGEALKKVFTNWEASTRDLRSLVVEFKRTTTDTVFGQSEEADGLFRLVRTPEGGFYATFELSAPSARKQAPMSEPFGAGLLNSRTVYLINNRSKTEFHLRIAEKDLLGILETYFNPLAVLLDRQRAEEKHQLKVEQDAHYTYLFVTPKKEQQASWFFSPMRAGRVVFANKSSNDVPKDMPRELWFAFSNGNSLRFDIKSWRMNAADGPTVDDLTSRAGRKDWQVEVRDWPSNWSVSK